MVVYPCIMHYVWFVESCVWFDGFPPRRPQAARVMSPTAGSAPLPRSSAGCDRGVRTQGGELDLHPLGDRPLRLSGRHRQVGANHKSWL